MQFDLFEEPVFGAAHIPIRAEDSKGLDFARNSRIFVNWRDSSTLALSLQLEY